jgi:eukaryotic-like serine/threonine-protein kinase
MKPERPLANELFLKALELPEEERARYLDQACGGDAPLRAEVDSLLDASVRAGSFLNAPVPLAGVSATCDTPLEVPGTQIGPYKLLQQIGEGGMGVVYMAEQLQPVRRRVALKVIKPGMDSSQVIARFEAERQALSLMEHPNIAKVLDAGTTASGRPYFVMELVKGQPITQYCDEHHLMPRQRLELLLPVCHAIQHAHQKGIIHRDIKPTNILVAEYDEKPVPKVIDFGVAKAIGSSLTERTMFTGFGQIVGTLEYMSPEQAKVNQLDIDTRSDIYSLGVLLYELLTGTTPHDGKRLRSAALDEMLRIIREEEPPRPSTRLSGSETLPSIAVGRSMEPALLSRTLRGELDWIVMKALEKDRGRRYETATAFAADLQHYLNDEPVQASPPSATYRLRKLLRRHQVAVAVTGAFVLLLITGTATSTYFAIAAAARAEESESHAEAARQNAEQAQKNFRKARAAVDRMLYRVASERLNQTPQAEILRKKLLEDALRFHKEFLEEAGDDPSVHRDAAFSEAELAALQFYLGTEEQAEANLQRAVGLLERVVDAHPEYYEAGWKLVRCRIEYYFPLRDRGERVEAEEQIREAVKLADRLHREAPEYGDLEALNLAYLCRGEWHQSQLKLDEAEIWLRKSLAIARKHHLEQYEGWSLCGLGGTFKAQKQLAAARDAYEGAGQAFDRFAANPENVADWEGKAAALCGLSEVVREMGQADEADALVAEAVSQYDLLTDNFPHYRYYAATPIGTRQVLAQHLNQRGRTEDADTQLRQAAKRAENLARAAPLTRQSLRTAYEVHAQRVRMWNGANGDKEANEALRQLKAFLEERSADAACVAALADELVVLHRSLQALQAEIAVADPADSKG